MLFNKYKLLNAYEEQIKNLKSDKTTSVNASQKNFLLNVNIKSLFIKI